MEKRANGKHGILLFLAGVEVLLLLLLLAAAAAAAAAAAVLLLFLLIEDESHLEFLRRMKSERLTMVLNCRYGVCDVNGLLTSVSTIKPLRLQYPSSEHNHREATPRSLSSGMACAAPFAFIFILNDPHDSSYK